MTERPSYDHPLVLPDLTPARWIWYPSQHCLPNTFVLFRRALTFQGSVRRATGWISADSRYLLTVNGRRVQWGPAPCDPRWLEADPVDLTSVLQEGENVIGATVLFYGQGDGTWAMGKPGFLIRLEVEDDAGERALIVSDSAWQAHLCRAWQPGHYKRFFIRALLEEFDARRYPCGWDTPAFKPDADWLAAMELTGSANQPPICTTYPDHFLGADGNREVCELRPRSTALLREYIVPVSSLSEQVRLTWHRPIEEYFEIVTPDACSAERMDLAEPIGENEWRVRLDRDHTVGLTFELPEQVVGWPRFEIEAAEGTTVELLVHEAHEIGGPPLLNTHFQSWSRFICHKGVNTFEEFDYESCRWIQLHLHGPAGDVLLRDVGIRRRVFPWHYEPHIKCGEPELQRLFDASINTLNNSCQETCVDGMGRERQQYSGDCGHQLHAVYMVCGDTTLPARFITTFSQGMTPEGYFLDCWPAYDRLARLMERAIDCAWWGPLIDHGIGFVFDCWHHYLYTGNLEEVREAFPRLLRFVEYLRTIRDEHGLLKVEELGTPCVWLDHIAYQRQRHKQCAFNLYAAAMLDNALSPLCEAFGESRVSVSAGRLASDLLDATIRRFWCPERRCFVINRPWMDEEGGPRMCDRSLSTAILFDQCPDGPTEEVMKLLVDCPPEMGFSYPANAGWRLWALAKLQRPDVIVKGLRERWATMDSVRLNNTLQEDWEVRPDSGSQWSHCAVAPLYILFQSLAGIRPIEPGFSRCEIWPQLADIGDLDLIARTVRGPIQFRSSGVPGRRRLDIQLPEGCEAELVLSAREEVGLSREERDAPAGRVRYRLAPGTAIDLELQHT